MKNDNDSVNINGDLNGESAANKNQNADNPDKLYEKLYCARGDMENRIKE